MIPTAGTSPWPNPAAVLEREPLARHTTFAVGGPADYFAVAESASDLAELLSASASADIPATVLGEGSNVLIGDDGVRGLVIHNRSAHVESLSESRLRAESGILMGRLAHWGAENGLAGLEFGVGIPGTLGGSIFGNAGCFGVEIKDVLVQAEVWSGGDHETYFNDDFDFAYRSSALQTMPGTPVVLGAVLKATEDQPDAIRQRMTELSRRRRDSQPAERSAGSIFRNPPGDHAGRLVEEAGLKGTQNGDAQISDLHANFIVNRGSATAAEIAALIDCARMTVAARSGVELEVEIRFIGEGFGDTR
jgi:UDP-N-acetylmuramate dehydrogenase